MSFLKNTTDVHNYNYELDCSQHNGIYKKSRSAWEKKMKTKGDK